MTVRCNAALLLAAIATGVPLSTVGHCPLSSPALSSPSTSGPAISTSPPLDVRVYRLAAASIISLQRHASLTLLLLLLLRLLRARAVI